MLHHNPKKNTDDFHLIHKELLLAFKITLLFFSPVNKRCRKNILTIEKHRRNTHTKGKKNIPNDNIFCCVVVFFHVIIDHCNERFGSRFFYCIFFSKVYLIVNCCGFHRESKAFVFFSRGRR